ncbi:MAG: hypothetical protein JMN24_14315 [gamma proteobacterium endosymbiont of Lamellibrachia anaximandri]|nr:hypothetical protein [gamma proteobacterium endosymbiont of Lamellibrachia anaximandri]MBL3618646.1 hypothetical protein [gamma proteobacterium endosymbiont of Lamellibrachia anaximandri]
MKQLLLLTLVLINGCALNPLKKEEQPKPIPIDDSLASAQTLAQEGRLGEAVALLETAILQENDDTTLQVTLDKLQQQKSSLRHELQDRLLIAEVHGMQRELPLMERLSLSESDDGYLRSRLMDKKARLQRSHKELSDCGWRYVKTDRELAITCLNLAQSIHNDVTDLRLLTQLQEKEQLANETHKQEARLAREMAWTARNQQRIAQAKSFLKQNILLEARYLIRLVLKEDPKNSEAKKLLLLLEAKLKGHVDTLLEAGDRLYRDDEIEGAKAAWHAALTLDPSDDRAKEKIKRAQKVLDNLESLKRPE